ncbi:caffeoylshikimate esterase [Pyrus ussuriensis x Pyrus communis]|uniref:Caffeoylshikimate esterase n=1 Tax=Pyrus ussuriensis x Pyrus communis TaxID=2448454 RepID=A0A5N5G7W2_9ROSA|nr:caffeoylshikimate esterase [Pyrus ussuriensis x Pyrus communis]
MVMYFQSPPDAWTGLIFSAPLFVIPENMKPSKVHLFLYGLLFGLADTWAAMPDNKMVGKAIKDPAKLKIIASNPRRYTGPPRVGTMREIARMCQYVQDNFSRVTAPFLTVHGTADGVTCPTSSQLLYEKGSSVDKTLKIYDGMYHSLVQGEPDENAEIVLRDMREWIDERVARILYAVSWKSFLAGGMLSFASFTECDARFCPHERILLFGLMWLCVMVLYLFGCVCNPGVLFQSDNVFDNFSGVMAPFLTVHGTADGVTCPTSSQLLYEKGSSADKTLKIYDGMYHSLVQGEPDKNAEIVLRDMREWIDKRVARYGNKAKGLEEGI